MTEIKTAPRGITRLILWISLAGMILALHLWIQKARGFDQGCFGVSKPEVAVEGGCREVSDLPASHLLGISNSAWGFAFYFGMAWLSFVKLVVSDRLARRLHGLSELGSALALIYSLYLVYSMGRAGAWCVLCLVSALFIAALFGLHAFLRARGGWAPLAEAERTAEFRAGVGALFSAAGGLLIVVFFINRIGTRPLDQGNARQELERLVGETLPIYIDSDKLREMRACHIDWNARAIDLKKFIGPSTPYIGRPDGIPVIMFFDPNCGYCKGEMPLFQQLSTTLKDRARFYIIPRVLWDYSITQSAALKLAEPTGKYFDLWRVMFERIRREEKDWSVAEVADAFKAVGLDTTDLEKRLQAVRPDVLALRRAAKDYGIDRLSAIYINDHQVWWKNHSEGCVAAIIDRRRAADGFPAP